MCSVDNVAGVRTMVMRGGSSKGLFFLASELPVDPTDRDQLLMELMGTPDARQIDGMGGAHPLTSKVAIVARCEHGTADVDYLFLQIGVGEALVTDRQNCGNLLAGIGPFALERGLITATGGQATTRIHMLNSDGIATAGFAVAAGAPQYAGNVAISGVPGTAAPITLEFEDIAGGTSGELLPTGNISDTVGGIDMTLIDNGMPVVVMRAADFGLSGYESCAELEANGALRSRLEELRLQAGPLMNLGEVATATIPKLTLVAPPQAGGHISTRTFIPHRCHQAIGVLGAVSVATAALLRGSPAAAELRRPSDGDLVTLEHPSGTFDALVTLEDREGRPEVIRAGIVRTARKLMDGVVYPRQY